MFLPFDGRGAERKKCALLGVNIRRYDIRNAEMAIEIDRKSGVGLVEVWHSEDDVEYLNSGVLLVASYSYHHQIAKLRADGEDTSSDSFGCVILHTRATPPCRKYIRPKPLYNTSSGPNIGSRRG